MTTQGKGESIPDTTNMKQKPKDGRAIDPGAEEPRPTRSIKMEIVWGENAGSGTELSFGVRVTRERQQECSSGGIGKHEFVRKEPTENDPPTEEQKMPFVVRQDEPQERSNGGIEMNESVKQGLVDKGTQTEEQDMPFALSQDEIWELAQKLNTFTTYELWRILLIADSHGQVPTQGPLEVNVFELEGDCMKEVYSYVEQTWMEKLREVNLLPPLPSSDADDEGESQQQDVNLENGEPGPSSAF